MQRLAQEAFPRRGVRLSLQFSISLVRTRHAACIEVEAELELHGRRFRAPDRPGGPHMNLQRTRAVARKEAIHILRDYRSLAVALGMPVLLLALFGYALSMDVDRITTAIYDEDHTAASENLINLFRGSRYFTVTDASSYALD